MDADDRLIEAITDLWEEGDRRPEIEAMVDNVLKVCEKSDE